MSIRFDTIAARFRARNRMDLNWPPTKAATKRRWRTVGLSIAFLAALQP